MPSQLGPLPPAAAALIGPGGPFEVVEGQVDGATLRLFKHAPPNLAELYRVGLEHADKDFFVYDDERYTFADAWARSEQVSASLRALGVKPGNRVGIAMRNYPEWVWAFMGITRLGAVAVAMNAWWSSEEMLYGIEDSGLKALFVDRERLEHIAPYLDEKSLDVVAVRTEHTSGRGVLPWDAFMNLAEPDMDLPEVDAEDYAMLLYTSGSTARPKGVISTHRAIVHALLGWEAAAAIAVAGREPRTPRYPPALLLTVPLFHVTGLHVQLLASFRAGRKVVGMYKWDVDKALMAIERERITIFSGVPSMAYELVRSPNYENYDLSSLKSMSGGGAALVPEHSKKINERSGGKVAPGTGYGMTETNGLATALGGRELLARPKSVGRSQPPLVDIKIVDSVGEEVPRGQPGEIWIRGPMNFSGYWNRPEATAETLTEGWVHTGDIGHMDDEDYVFITDRLKDMVIRGGENIGCQEVEAVILDHPKVQESAVFGVPHPRLGETLAATVVRAPDSDLTAGELQSFVAEHLARFKVPEHVWIRETQLPRIASGKIYKRGLREEAIEALTNQASD